LGKTNLIDRYHNRDHQGIKRKKKTSLKMLHDFNLINQTFGTMNRGYFSYVTTIYCTNTGETHIIVVCDDWDDMIWGSLPCGHETN
jgi:archaellum component FlaG (FlaF/FlaG flagellin family)